MRTRTAGHGDAETIARNNVDMAWETEGRALDQARALEGVRAVLADPSKGFYIVAEEGGAVVGQVMLTVEWSDWRNGEFWWVQSVYVRPQERGHGVLTEMFREVEDRCSRSERCVGLRLYVDRHNEVAKHAYARLGLEPSHYEMYEREKRG